MADMNKYEAAGQKMFDAAPPGYSFTQNPKKYPWDKPPKYPSADKAVDAVIDRFEDPDIELQTLQLMFAGVSIEEIVRMTLKMAFQEGWITVDVQQIAALPLTIYLMGLASEAGIAARVYNTRDGAPRKNYGMKDAQILTIMRSRNPDMEKYVTQGLPQEIQMERQMAREQMMQQEKRVSGGFLGVAAPEQENEE